MSEPTTLEDMRKAALTALSRGVADRKHPARHPTLATCAADGPQQRTVVLRGFDRTLCQLEMHTDAASAKVAELITDPRASLHIWIPRQKMQLRLSVDVALITADGDRWGAVPERARRVYGGAPAPGTEIATPESYAPAPELARFTTLLCRLHRMDLLHLGEAMHRRAIFEGSGSDWTGKWCAP